MTGDSRPQGGDDGTQEVSEQRSGERTIPGGNTSPGDGETDVCVHGLGYIGLPTATVLATRGWSVVGYDTDPAVREGLAAGDVHVDEPGLDALVAEALDAGGFALSGEVVPASYHVVCVPTPRDADGGGADLSYVEAAASAIRPHLRDGDAVVVESTVPPGATADTVRPLLEAPDLSPGEASGRDAGEASGRDAGEAFDLVYCPETALPGNTLEELRTNDRILGAVEGGSVEPAIRLYDSFVEGEIREAPDATTAEFVKLIQNTFRDANVALANEIAKLAHDYGVDTARAIGLANHHPRVDIHDPGPGVGGHCLPIDPWFLGHDSAALDLVSRARQVNESMTDHVLEILAEELKPTRGATVGILGVAYKGDVGDTRQSPGLALARRLRGETSPGTATGSTGTAVEATEPASRSTGPASESPSTPLEDAPPPDLDAAVPNGGSRPFAEVEVALHDSHVEDDSLDLSPLDDVLGRADAVVITADHDEYAALEPERVADRMAGDVVLDTKAAIDPAEWADADVTLRRL
jgi:UDP-N-acetyl-D-mannosaminuronic acid dehydrogenase